MLVFYSDIKSLPITSYLAFKGIRPLSKVTDEAYYLCPYRAENRPSLAVNVNKNVWFDFGENVGGSIIDLAMRIHNGDRVKANEDLARFASFVKGSHDIAIDDTPPVTKRQNGIRIINVRELCHTALAQYITSRGIPIEIAKKYCKEVWFECTDGRRCFAIGLPNIAKGWELRGLKSFKTSSHPKAISLFRSNVAMSRVCVFEGLFDMLSYVAYCHFVNDAEPSCDLLCLNSLSLINSSFNVLYEYSHIDIYLDADSPGRNATSKLLLAHPNAKDRSTLYSAIPNCKDLNQWYIRFLISLNQIK